MVFRYFSEKYIQKYGSNECASELADEFLAVDLPMGSLGTDYLCGVNPAGRILACIDPEALGPLMLQRPGDPPVEPVEQGCCTSSMQSEQIDGSVLDVCPGCSENLGGMAKDKSQKHVSSCLEKRRGSIVGSSYTGTLSSLNMITLLCHE